MLSMHTFQSSLLDWTTGLLDWTAGLDWIGLLDWTGLGCWTGLDWAAGLDWIGLQDWTGLGCWTGLDWAAGLDWIGLLDWTGPASKFVEHMQEQADRLRGVLDELPLQKIANCPAHACAGRVQVLDRSVYVCNRWV